ncbi:MAG: hypothetical protein LBC99_03475 [Spirochaetota bacterium]|jgi:tetratricopeptide (TPR) repeat protein|nr:hypothetical protein [Spirochaetota bacterium]
MRKTKIFTFALLCAFCAFSCKGEPPVPAEIRQARAAEAAGKYGEARKILEAAEAAHLDTAAFSYALALLSYTYFDDFYKGEIKTIIINDPGYKIFGHAIKMNDAEGRDLGFMLRDLSPVIEILDRAIGRDPKYADPWLQKAICLAEMDQMPRALEILSNAQKYLPSEARVPFLAGNMYAHQENHEQAARAFAEARKKNSRDSGAALYHGISLLALDRAEEAEEALGRAADLAKGVNANDADRAVYEMFSWYFGQEEYQKAYAWGKKHLDLVKKRDKLYRTLGIAAYLSDHYAEAGKWLGEAIAQGAENALSLALYAQIHVSEGKFAEAEALFKRSLKHEETVQVLAQLGSLYLEKLNSPAQAIIMLERVIELQPIHYLARYQLALAYQAAGRDAKTEMDAWIAYLAVIKLITLEELGAQEKEYVETARARIRELDAVIDP